MADPDVQLLSAFGTEAAVALKNARSYEQLTDRPAQAAGVIFLTGDSVSEETRWFLQAAERPVLTKPVLVAHLHRVVQEVLTAAGAAWRDQGQRRPNPSLRALPSPV